MKVFVTGATGFIGQRTVRRLRKSGHSCHCLVRPSSSPEVLSDYGCHLLIGDIDDRESLVAGMRRCDAVIHLANLYSLWEPDRGLYERTNIDGTRNVMEACLTAGVHKVVHISSIVTWGRSSEVPFNELSPVGKHTSEYARTKYEGDQVAWNLHKNQGLPLVMIYPCAVLGAGDPKSTGNHIGLLVRKKMPIRGLERARVTFVHVDDVAEAIVRALEKEGNVGQGYIVGKEQLAIGQLNRMVSEISGVPLPRIAIPDFMVRINAFFLTALANITKRPPLWGLSSDFVRNARTDLRADGAKAERELGITYTPVRQAIEECIQALVSNQETSL